MADSDALRAFYDDLPRATRSGFFAQHDWSSAGTSAALAALRRGPLKMEELHMRTLLFGRIRNFRSYEPGSNVHYAIHGRPPDITARAAEAARR